MRGGVDRKEGGQNEVEVSWDHRLDLVEGEGESIKDLGNLGGNLHLQRCGEELGELDGQFLRITEAPLVSH